MKNPYADIISRGINERGSVRTAFRGRSMAPTLLDGMLIEADSIEPVRIRAGDVILYRRADQMVVHRVIGVSRGPGERIFVTKGDNQAYMESERVREESLMGIVRGAFREDEPRKNLLVENRAIGLSYVAMGRLADFAMRNRTHVPRFVRLALRHIVGALFLAFKRSIHVAYRLSQGIDLSTK